MVNPAELLKVSWSRFKTEASAKGLDWYYVTVSDGYKVFAIGAVHGMRVALDQTADVTDFEDNYKSSATSVVNEAEAVSITLRRYSRSVVTSSDGSRDVSVVEDTADGLNRFAISGKVSVTAPPPPIGATPITIAADDPLSVSAHDTDYIITSGKDLHIQQIVVGAAGDPNEKGSKVTVIFDDGTEHVIERIYVSGFTNFGSYPDTAEARDGTPLVGNGTNKLIIRREKLGGTAREVDAVIRGYEETI